MFQYDRKLCIPFIAYSSQIKHEKKSEDTIWYTALLYIIYNSTLVQSHTFNNVFLKAIFLLPKKKKQNKIFFNFPMLFSYLATFLFPSAETEVTSKAAISIQSIKLNFILSKDMKSFLNYISNILQMYYYLNCKLFISDVFYQLLL